MSQFLRPDSDVTSTNIFSGTYLDIDEAVASDADYIESNALDLKSSVYECGLSNPTNTPGPGTTTVRYRSASNAGGASLVCDVYEGTTLVDSDTSRTLSSTITTWSFTPDMSAVSDWTAVRLKFTFSGTAGASPRLYWAEMEAPDAATGKMMLMF